VTASLIGNALREHAEGCTLALRVQPGAKKSAITGVFGDGREARLKVALQAPPIEGQANDALITFLAEFFGLSRSAVVIAHGQTGRSKLVNLRGIRAEDAMGRIRSKL
jgi:uncharacterized protein (TIGR00251 family)